MARMLESHARNAPTYWLQLCIALSLATLGLVLNGTAVVIGAMLVSPLMSPIIELGMGLAVGSPLLSIRSLIRTLGSIVVVVAGATLITAALPFHEITHEISVRASPTALDLLIAIFCALAAALTTLRSASDSAISAAGTAVAIALVPPLCVVGFGLGADETAIAAGAFLLFTANLCAILTFAAATFWLFGFNLVDVHRLEETRFDHAESLGRTVRWARILFKSRYGSWFRVIVPLALVAIVWLPLRRALHEVTWDVRTRAKIQRIIHKLPLAEGAVRSSIAVDHGTVHVRLVVMATSSEAHALQVTLGTRIAAVSNATPVVEIVAVPDLAAMQEVARNLARQSAEEPPRPRPAVSAAVDEIDDVLRDAWPRSVVGDLRHWRLDRVDKDQARLQVTHIGQPLGGAAEGLLAAVLVARLGYPVSVSDEALPQEAVMADLPDGARWLPSLSLVTGWLQADRDLSACVVLPDDRSRLAGRRRKDGMHDAKLEEVLMAARAEISRMPSSQVTIASGPRWLVQLQPASCGAMADTSRKGVP